MNAIEPLDWLPDAVCMLAAPLPSDATLEAAEAALVATFAARRRRHFAAGRACARLALARLGQMPEPLLRAVSGAPLWPAGIVGSIAHCEGAAVAIAAQSERWQALGIDVEVARPLPDDVMTYALSAAEREHLARLPGGLARWALPAFGAKECVHKCLHPLRDAFLEFTEVAISFAPDSARFKATPLTAKAEAAFAGFDWQGALRWQDDVVLTVLAGRRPA